SAWIYVNATTGLSQTIVGHSAASPNLGWRFYVEPAGNGFTFDLSTGGTTYNDLTLGAAGSFVGGWNHVVAVFNPGVSGQLYLNGALANTVATSVSTIHVSSADPAIGFSATGYFNGTIDDARVYNRALSAAEITALYYNGDVSAVCAGPTGNEGDMFY